MLLHRSNSRDVAVGNVLNLVIPQMASLGSNNRTEIRIDGARRNVIDRAERTGAKDQRRWPYSRNLEYLSCRRFASGDSNP